MSEQNPYQFPSSPSAPVAAVPAALSAPPRSVGAGRGWDWIAEAFALFKKQPGTWILILIVSVVCAVVIVMVPVLGALVNFLLMQVFMGGLMLGCRALEHDEPLELAHLFAGFK